jgi:hypothetical protein
MEKITFPVPDTVRAALGRDAVTHFRFADSPGAMADHAIATGRIRGADEWSGGLEAAEAARRCHYGDLAQAAASDALLSRFERFGFESVRREWRDDISGQIPNVPAFIAGTPLAMRRRVKVESPAAPLAIVVDLTSSAMISSKQLERRGAAILAIVRVLSARRPVELWAGTITDANNRRDATAHFARIETAPLDLARAAFVLVSPAFPRQLCYGASRLDGFEGHWPFGSDTASREFMADLLRPAMLHIGDFLAIPGAHLSDEMHKNPEAWIESTLARLEGTEAAAA